MSLVFKPGLYQFVRTTLLFKTTRGYVLFVRLGSQISYIIETLFSNILIKYSSSFYYPSLG